VTNDDAELEREQTTSDRFDRSNASVRADCEFYDDFEDDFVTAESVGANVPTTTTTTEE